jgi:hypothetical protein
MRRNRLLCGLLALSWLFATTAGVWAGEWTPPKNPSKGPVAPFGGAVPVCPFENGIPEPSPLPPPPCCSGGTDFVHELITILNETRSSDAFIATVLALHRAGVDGKLVVPAIIKNAERLKLFIDTNPDQGTAQQKTILKAVMLMLKKSEHKVRTTRPQTCSVPNDPLGGACIGAATGGACIGAAAGGAVGALVGGACSSSPIPVMPTIPDPPIGDSSPCK